MKRHNIYFGNFRIEKRFFDDGTRYYLYRKYGYKVIGGVDFRNEEVLDLWINKSYRRQGLATRLMKELISDYKNSCMALMADGDEYVSNKDLRVFYRSLGFKSDRYSHNFMVREGEK